MLRFEICKTSDFEYQDTKEFETLEDLIEFIKTTPDGSVVIETNSDFKNPDKLVLEIYDTWRE